MTTAFTANPMKMTMSTARFFLGRGMLFPLFVQSISKANTTLIGGLRPLVRQKFTPQFRGQGVGR